MNELNDQPLNDAEWAEFLDLRAKFQAAYRANPEGVTQAFKDMVQLPSLSGKL